MFRKSGKDVKTPISSLFVDLVSCNKQKTNVERTSPKPQSRTPVERQGQRVLSRGRTAREACGPCGVHRLLRQIWQTRRFDGAKRNQGREQSDTEYSIKLSLSEGAHSSNVLDSALDARHSLNVKARR